MLSICLCPCWSLVLDLFWSVCVDFISCVQLRYEILVHALLDAQHGVRLIWLVGNALDLPLCCWALPLSHPVCFRRILCTHLRVRYWKCFEISRVWMDGLVSDDVFPVLSYGFSGFLHTSVLLVTCEHFMHKLHCLEVLERYFWAYHLCLGAVMNGCRLPVVLRFSIDRLVWCSGPMSSRVGARFV
jgi:hypothetical protein